ncbi:uncharacterized protein DDB_G0287625-like [Pecten maximus]|uniref:uncharacterized protein DDB_G0287625-like n=1 Tax=Pecten maximus TaxID=6579 RepID=UPI0014590D93|nr:uncharacterized protein DDB_G0287625-like [Pecten maximus]
MAGGCTFVSDDSIIHEELEVLESIYIGELEVDHDDRGHPSSISLQLHPSTGEDVNKKFVCMTLVLNLPGSYPMELPEIIIRNPRGIGEEELESLHEAINQLAEERRGGHMLYDIIELAKESLTDGNVPHCPCTICLEHFCEGEEFTRTDCYHYFHQHCLYRYVSHTLESLKSEANQRPKYKELGQDDTDKVFCPVCREVIDYDLDHFKSLSQDQVHKDNCLLYRPSADILQWQVEMAAILETQKQKGGIIDLEEEKNKFLVTAEDTVQLPWQGSSSEVNNLARSIIDSKTVLNEGKERDHSDSKTERRNRGGDRPRPRSGHTDRNQRYRGHRNYDRDGRHSSDGRSRGRVPHSYHSGQGDDCKRKSDYLNDKRSWHRSDRIDVSKSHRTDVSKSQRTDVSTSQRTDVSKSPRTDVSKSHQTDVSKSPRTDVSTSQRTDVSKSPRTDVSKSPRTDVSKSHRTDVSKSQRTDVSKSQRTDVSKSPRTDVSTSQRTDVSKSHQTDVSKSPQTDVSKSQRIDVSKSQRTDVSKSQRTDVSKSQRIDVSKSNRTEASKSDHTDVIDGEVCSQNEEFPASRIEIEDGIKSVDRTSAINNDPKKNQTNEDKGSFCDTDMKQGHAGHEQRDKDVVIIPPNKTDKETDEVSLESVKTKTFLDSGNKGNARYFNNTNYSGRESRRPENDRRNFHQSKNDDREREQSSYGRGQGRSNRGLGRGSRRSANQETVKSKSDKGQVSGKCDEAEFNDKYVRRVANGNSDVAEASEIHDKPFKRVNGRTDKREVGRDHTQSFTGRNQTSSMHKNTSNHQTEPQRSRGGDRRNTEANSQKYNERFSQDKKYSNKDTVGSVDESDKKTLTKSHCGVKRPPPGFAQVPNVNNVTIPPGFEKSSSFS